ncbi:hypothetical protein HNR65_003552 [Desulfosalsimonas propionicica]|uniref:Uncharacterized protein n=1 Tax=Desulfosalsimonas propionicica TaxID=332175 RepID=A0A7W0HMB4_9BACT|nr:hypothetical protein [Desulfosalsimonas propionicica]
MKKAYPGKDFRIISRHSAGNLHVSLTGDFTGRCAWELFKTIRQNSANCKRIFVDTERLQKIIPAGVSLFKHHMGVTPMRRDWLYFKGDNGFKIAPDGARVLIKKRNTKRSGGKHEKSADYLRYDNR